MSLLTPAQIREHVETDLADPAIERLIADAESEIVARCGAHDSQTDLFRTGDPRVFPSGVDLFIFPSRPVGQVVSITEEERDGTSTVLAEDDYRILDGGRRIERLQNGTHPRARWGHLVKLVYQPVDDMARRTRVLIDLVRLAIEYRAYQEQWSGDVRTRHVDYQQERERILRALAPRGGLGVFA